MPVLILLYRLLLWVKKKIETKCCCFSPSYGQWAEPGLLASRMLLNRDVWAKKAVSLLAKCQWKRLTGFLSWPFLSDSWQETHNAVTTVLVPGEAAHLKAVLYLAIISYH